MSCRRHLKNICQLEYSNRIHHNIHLWKIPINLYLYLIHMSSIIYASFFFFFNLNSSCFFPYTNSLLYIKKTVGKLHQSFSFNFLFISSQICLNYSSTNQLKYENTLENNCAFILCIDNFFTYI